MTITTSTRPAEADRAVNGPSRSTVRDAPAPRGRVAARTGAAGGPGRPQVRPMLISSNSRSARVCLVPEGALLLAGDEIEIRVSVGAGAALELVEPGGTVAYDMRGGHARWDVEMQVATGATLVWGAEPFVVAEGADVRRTTRLDLAADARVVLRETLVLGRHGEQPGRLAQRLDVTGPGWSPVLVEELAVDGRSAPGILGDHRVVSSVLALGLALPEEAAPAGRYDLESHGTWWRGLGHEVHRTVPHEAWTAALAACRG